MLSNCRTLAEAIDLLKVGRFEAVETFCRDLVRGSPGYAPAWNLLGVTLARRQNLVGAILAFQKAAEVDPNKPEFQLNCGKALHSVGRFAEAVPYLRVAIEDNSGNGEALYLLGTALMAMGVLDEALSVLAAAAELAPEKHVIWQALGIAYFRLNRFPMAIVALKRATELKPNDAGLMNDLGLALRGARKYADAIVWFRSARATGAVSAANHCNLGLALIDVGAFAEAERELRQAIELKPDYPEALAGLPR